MKQPKSAFGKNNFDRLEAAGLVATEGDETSAKAKTEKRVADLQALEKKLANLEAGAADLYVMDKPRRLKRLTAMITAVQKLSKEALPVGTKRHITACLNELVSLREGVYATNTQMDRKALTLMQSTAARKEVKNMVSAAQARLEKVMAESMDSSDMEDFFRNAGEVIKKHAQEADKVSAIRSKPFVVVRVPIAPADGNISVEKLVRMGFKAESLGGYPVLHNQLVIGISPKALLGDGAALMKSERTGKELREEAARLIKMLSKKTNQRLQFVSDKSYSFDSGVWFWAMPDRDLDLLAKAAPGAHVKINRWGFAFNSEANQKRQGNMSKGE